MKAEHNKKMIRLYDTYKQQHAALNRLFDDLYVLHFGHQSPNEEYREWLSKHKERVNRNAIGLLQIIHPSLLNYHQTKSMIESRIMKVLKPFDQAGITISDKKDHELEKTCKTKVIGHAREFLGKLKDLKEFQTTLISSKHGIFKDRVEYFLPSNNAKVTFTP